MSKIYKGNKKCRETFCVTPIVSNFSLWLRFALRTELLGKYEGHIPFFHILLQFYISYMSLAYMSLEYMSLELNLDAVDIILKGLGLP